MIDFTKEIQLEKYWQKRYIASRALLYLIFIIGAFFVSYWTLLPSIAFTYSFANSGSLKNNIDNLRTTIQEPLISGKMEANEIFLFNANPLGSFFDADIQITTSKQATTDLSGDVSVRKSYASFFYSQGQPVGFKNGTLLSVGSDFYMISGDKLRKFSSPTIASELGFSKDAFIPVSRDDLVYNQTGENISNSVELPESSLIKNAGSYYLFENKTLTPFISTKAFLSQYADSQAIAKNDEFLKQYPVSEKTIGFADGTLASSDLSIFILSRGKMYPIMNPETFVAMGLDWNNVIGLTPDEFGGLERQKQFTFRQPHPDGTIFFDQKTESYFMVDNLKLRPIKSFAIAKTYLIKNAVKVDSSSLIKKASCQFKPGMIYKNVQSCTLKLDDLATLPGNDFEFSAKLNSDVTISSIDTNFYTPVSLFNLRVALSKIRTKIYNNYGIVQ